MTYTVKNHRLLKDGIAVPFKQTPNGGAALKPRYYIIHYTAGTTASGAINHFLNPTAQASAHLVLERDGSITQMMAFNRVCWHAGRSRWHDLVGLNHHSIGIEIVNAGKLHKSEAGDGSWHNYAHNKINPADVIVATHKDERSSTGWHNYTEKQIAAVIAIGKALNDTYNLDDVLGHDDISPGRKVDPGPAFPMISVQSQIIGRQ